MAHTRIKLSTLLILFTFFAITVGSGTQIYLLKQQVGELKREVTRLNQSSSASFSTVFRQPRRENPQNQTSPFRLLNNETLINTAVENGMKAGEWELKHRFEEHRNRDEIPSPKTNTPDQSFESPLRSAN